MAKNNLVIIGMLGIDKKEIGKALSYALSMQFCDTDELLEYEYATIKTLVDILNVSGYRKYESIVVNQVSSYENTVISTGEGVVYKEENVAILRNTATIVLLEGDLKSMFSNVAYKEKVFLPKGNFKEFSELYKLYRDKYYESADIVVNVHLKNNETIVNEIIEKLLEKF